MPPESLAMRIFDQKTDVWAFSVVILEICTRKVPYCGIASNQVAKKVMEGELFPSLPTTAPEALKKLSAQCCAPHPKDRPTFEQIGEMLLKDFLG